MHLSYGVSLLWGNCCDSVIVANLKYEIKCYTIIHHNKWDETINITENEDVAHKFMELGGLLTSGFHFVFFIVYKKIQN